MDYKHISTRKANKVSTNAIKPSDEGKRKANVKEYYHLVGKIRAQLDIIKAYQASKPAAPLGTI